MRIREVSSRSVDRFGTKELLVRFPPHGIVNVYETRSPVSVDASFRPYGDLAKMVCLAFSSTWGEPSVLYWSHGGDYEDLSAAWYARDLGEDALQRLMQASKDGLTWEPVDLEDLLDAARSLLHPRYFPKR